MKKSSFNSGLTMIEILIVTAVIGLLVIIAITTLPQQINKGRDGRRKSDLQSIKVAFENYYSDKDCYPDPGILDNCGSADLAPYLSSIPCDPKTKTKYLYAPEVTSCPHYYRIYSNLEVDVDPVIQVLGCNGVSGCGAYATFGDELGQAALDYDYGVSQGVPVYDPDGIPPELTSGYCCSNEGNCDNWTQGYGSCAGTLFPDLNACTANCN